MDMDSFFIQPNEQGRETFDPVLYASKDPDFYVVVPTLEDKIRVKQFLLTLNKSYESRKTVTVISALDFHPLKSQMDSVKKIVKLYQESPLDLSTMIPAGSRIITVGTALNAITKSTDLSVNGFYDIVFNKSWFYAPHLKSHVFPVDDFEKWLSKDNWESYFANRQFQQAKAFVPTRMLKDDLEITVIGSVGELRHCAGTSQFVAADIETSGLNFFTDTIGCITFSFDGKAGYYLPWDKVNVQELGDFLSPRYQIWANGKFDIKFLMHNGVKRECLRVDGDVVQMAHVLNEMSRNSLKASAWIYTNHGGYDLELKKYLKDTEGSYLDAPADMLVKYATMDTILTWQIYFAMKAQIEEIDRKLPMKNGWSLWRYYHEVVLPAINCFIDVEYRGMTIDKKRLDEISKELIAEIEQLTQEIHDSFGVSREDLSLASPAQLGALLQERGWIKLATGAKGQYLTNDAMLNRWRKEGYKEAEMLVKLRGLQMMYKTFISGEEDEKGYYQFLNTHEDGSVTVNATFHVMLADSGRNRCSQPNLQQIPRTSDWGKKFRSIFVPPEGYLLGEWDAAGLQLRIAGILSKDSKMREAFMDPAIDGDLHSVTARGTFRRDLSIEEFIARKEEPELDALRFKAKAINFGLIFGSSAFSFATNSIEPNWTLDECKEYITRNDMWKKYEFMLTQLNTSGMRREEFTKEENERFVHYWTVATDLKKRFFEEYAGLEHWIEGSIELAKKNGYIRSTFGSFRRLPQLLYSGVNSFQREVKNLSNVSVNSPVQAFEAVLIMKATVALDTALRMEKMKSYIIGNIHDSCVMYVHKSEVEIVRDLIKRCFEKPVVECEGVPMKADFKVADYSAGEVWGFGKKVR